jgi:hypothetical protein
MMVSIDWEHASISIDSYGRVECIVLLVDCIFMAELQVGRIINRKTSQTACTSPVDLN